MKTVDSNKYGILDDKRLILFERKIGARLPEEYRQFLIEHNGGKPSPCDFKISETEGEDSLHHFYGLHSGPSYLNLEQAYKNHKGRVPTTMIPFADDPAGNAICIGIGGNDTGKIFFWDHELEVEEDDNEPSCQNITEISNSFSGFLNALFEWVDPDESSIEKIIRENNLSALAELLDSGYDVETTNEYGRTIMEDAAIAANNDMVRLLLERGAKVRNALDLAKQNAVFFEQHKSTVLLINEFLNRI